MGGEKIGKKVDPLAEELSKMSDQELIGIALAHHGVIQNDCFNHKDVIMREYAIRELEKRGYYVSIHEELVIEKGDEE
jgi:hypothetical protein